MLMVFLSALFWSFGGTIARFLEVQDSWTVVFWRCSWAAIFLLGYMLWRDGGRGTLALFRGMGMPGIAVALCAACASTSFVVALSYTTVANILLMQAGTPLIAALLAWAFLGERVSLPTWFAIGAVIVGVGIMVSGSLSGDVSPVGNALALLIAVVFACATVITRRYHHVRMTPATCLGTAIAACFAATQAGGFTTSSSDAMLLFVFGALNLGLGFALFASGARLIPAAYAALIGTSEPLLGPIWVWLVHGEVPSLRTVIGGLVVFLALLAHIGLEFRRGMKPARPGVTGVSQPF